MKFLARKATAIAVACIFSFSMFACAGKQVPMNTAAETVSMNKEDPYKHKYVVTFNNGAKFSFSDEDIDVKGNHIGLRYDGDAEFKHYSLDQVQEIRIGTKRHWLAGAGIGAGVGGLAMGLGFGLGAKCSSTSDSDCKGLHALGTVFVSIAGAVAGFGIGAGIGSAIPRKKDKSNIVVTPQVYTHGGMSVHGGGLGVSGSF